VSRLHALSMERDDIGARPPTNRPNLPILTTLRFFAAAEVVAFHVAQTRPGWARPVDFLSGLVSGGYAAVVFFFVLSGFILAYVHAGENERSACNVKAARFWRLRFARIAPAYYLGLLLALPILTQVVAQSQASGWSVAFGMTSVMLFAQAWWPAYTTLWNFPAWSLSVECAFYALFPWLARMLARWPAVAVLVGSYVLIVLTDAYRGELLGRAGLLGAVPKNDWLVLSAFPILYLPLFIFGMALARLYLFGRVLSPRLHAAMLGIGVALTVLIFGGAWMLPGWTRSDPALALGFALIVFGGAGAAGTFPLLARPTFVLLGEASYSMYILHIPLRVCWDNLAAAVPGLNGMPWLNFPLYFGFVVLVSVVVFRVVETPLRKWIAGRVEPVHPGGIPPVLQAGSVSSARA
jgi:peptidoglycan/LPS O-acetylase OafA/YrhL